MSLSEAEKPLRAFGTLQPHHVSGIKFIVIMLAVTVGGLKLFDLAADGIVAYREVEMSRIEVDSTHYQRSGAAIESLAQAIAGQEEREVKRTAAMLALAKAIEQLANRM